MPSRGPESSAELWSGLFNEYSARTSLSYRDLLSRPDRVRVSLVPGWTIEPTIEPTIKAKSYHKISLLFDKEREILDGTG